MRKREKGFLPGREGKRRFLIRWIRILRGRPVWSGRMIRWPEMAFRGELGRWREQMGRQTYLIKRPTLASIGYSWEGTDFITDDAQVLEYFQRIKGSNPIWSWHASPSSLSIYVYLKQVLHSHAHFLIFLTKWLLCCAALAKSLTWNWLKRTAITYFWDVTFKHCNWATLGQDRTWMGECLGTHGAAGMVLDNNATECWIFLSGHWWKHVMLMPIYQSDTASISWEQNLHISARV